MRRSAAVSPAAEPTPWRLYLLLFVSWVLVALLGGPDTVAGSGNGPLPHEPVAAVHEAAERTLRSTFRVAIRDVNDDSVPWGSVAIDPGADAVMMWHGDQLISFRDQHDAYLINEGPGRRWHHLTWPVENRPHDMTLLILAGFDIEAYQVPLWLDGVTEAVRTGPRSYAGTIDKRRAGPRHPGIARDLWDGGGSSEEATVSFEAEVDSRGRLVRLTLWPDAKEKTQTFHLSGFGDSVRPPSPSSADVEETDW